nr:MULTISPECIES: hypothetical protein [unclassified Bradyrhizobium]
MGGTEQTLEIADAESAAFVPGPRAWLGQPRRNRAERGFPHFLRLERGSVEQHQQHDIAVGIELDAPDPLAPIGAFGESTSFNLDTNGTPGALAYSVISGCAGNREFKTETLCGGELGNLAGHAKRLACERVIFGCQRPDGS